MQDARTRANERLRQMSLRGILVLSCLVFNTARRAQHVASVRPGADATGSARRNGFHTAGGRAGGRASKAYGREFAVSVRVGKVQEGILRDTG